MRCLGICLLFGLGLVGFFGVMACFGFLLYLLHGFLENYMDVVPAIILTTVAALFIAGCGLGTLFCKDFKK